MLLRFALIFVIFYFIFRTLRSIAGRNNGERSGKLNADSKGEDMVLDPQCQSYVPKSNAIAAGGRHFCSRECAQLYLSR
jgi:hypothetical protein